MDNRRVVFWRWLALLLALILVPALCVMGAFASRLQITSPYFSLSFGPQGPGEPPMIVLTGGPNVPPVVDVAPPGGTPPPNTGNPQPPGNSASGASCLLGLVCLSVSGGLGGTELLNIDLGKATVTANPAQSGGDSTLSLGVDAQLPVVGSQLGAGLDVGQDGVQVDADVDLLDSEESNTSEGLELNVLDTLQVGVGGGSGGVSIGLTLPSLFP